MFHFSLKLSDDVFQHLSSWLLQTKLVWKCLVMVSSTFPYCICSFDCNWWLDSCLAMHMLWEWPPPPSYSKKPAHYIVFTTWSTNAKKKNMMHSKRISLGGYLWMLTLSSIFRIFYGYQIYNIKKKEQTYYCWYVLNTYVSIMAWSPTFSNLKLTTIL